MNHSPLKIGFVTLFPEIINATVGVGILRRAAEAGLVEFSTSNPRDFTYDRHRSVDDSPFGGEPGMLMKPEPVALALEALRFPQEGEVLFLDPGGEVFNQKMADDFKSCPSLAILCGHYEGIDWRVAEEFATRIVSLGEFVLTGGELPALVIADAVTRRIDGVLGNEKSLLNDTFSDQFGGGKSPPSFTRPFVWRGRTAPEELISGDPKVVAAWKRKSLQPDRTAPEDD